jgi:hypothetical protein
MQKFAIFGLGKRKEQGYYLTFLLGQETAVVDMVGHPRSAPES